MSESYYITTPIYYVNDLPHIGHIYTTVMADIFARYNRLAGRRVYFLTGTDEHGQKIERAAKEQGIAPKALADRVVERYHQLWKVLEISHDDFIRTTEDRHQRAVHEMIRRMAERGDIYKGSYTGWYCAGCEAFYPETQLVEGKCPDQGHPVERLSEPSYFFRLSAYQDRLLQWYRDNPECIQPRSRHNEVVRFVKGGLHDLSVSRTSIRWGIPWPGDPEHVVYVWLDALTNYVSALGFGSEDTALFDRFWPADVHLVGKDILRFHCVYWPAFLMSAGLPLPRVVFGHGWWKRGESKMSKSFGNVVRPDPHIRRFGPDAVRYFLAREMTFGADASFSDEAFVERYNADLANHLGNAASRTLSMIGRFLGGTVPAAGSEEPVVSAVRDAVDKYHRRMQGHEPHRALEAVWAMLATLNGFIQERQPWAIARGGEAARPELEAVLGTAAECLRITSILVEPFMPATARALREGLGNPQAPADLVEGTRWGLLPGGAVIGKPKALFPRVDVKEFMKELQMEQEATTGSEAREESATPQITIDELAKVQLRVGLVLEAERIPKSKKLLRLKVDLGEPEPRQIVAGMAESYEPEQMVGRRVVVVANLKPARLMGVESQGMILAADIGGKAFLLSPDGEVPPGATVR